MGAAPAGREERALQVEAQRLGAVGRGTGQPRPDPLGEGGQVVERRRTAVGRNDVTPRRRSARAMPSSAARVAHRVVAAPAVDVEVDEPGRDERSAGASLVAAGVELDRRDPAVARP